MLLKNKKEDNLYIVESPLQLLSAVEANEYFTGSSMIILKYSTNKKTNVQLKNIIEKFSNFNNLLEIYPSISNFDANIKLFILLNKMIKNNITFEKIFIGEYRSFHMRKFFDVLSPEECYLLDDGNIIIDMAKYIELKKDQYYFDDLKGKIKKIIYSSQSLLLGLSKYKIRRDISLFTCFDLKFNRKDIICIRHDFNYLKSMNKIKDSTNIVYFYGSNLAMLNINNKLEMQYLRYVLNYYKKQKLEVIYIPHRNEMQKKISYIQDNLAIKIQKNIFPAEIQLVLDTKVPKHIASFVSSVLVSLPTIYSFDSVVSFQFPLNSVPNKYRNELIVLKEEYKKQMIVVEIKEI